MVVPLFWWANKLPHSVIYVDQHDRFQEIIKYIWKELLYECSVCVWEGGEYSCCQWHSHRCSSRNIMPTEILSDKQWIWHRKQQPKLDWSGFIVLCLSALLGKTVAITIIFWPAWLGLRRGGGCAIFLAKKVVWSLNIPLRWRHQQFTRHRPPHVSVHYFGNRKGNWRPKYSKGGERGNVPKLLPTLHVSCII